jgi:hypothetical protein
MEWAELVLEYVKALAWPTVLGGAVFAFRRQIADKIKDLKDATTPVGGASFFDREADAVEEKAELAAERQEAARPATPPVEPETTAEMSPSPAGAEPRIAEDMEDVHEGLERAVRRRMAKYATFAALSTAWAQLNALPNFDQARNMATVSPQAAVLLAWADLEKVARAAWTVARMAPPDRATALQVIRSLARSGSLDADFAQIARDLSNLRARVAHGDSDPTEVSVKGAIDFIGATEQLSGALANNAMSKIRHPSRSQVIREWMDWAGQQGRAEGEGGETGRDDDDHTAA